MTIQPTKHIHPSLRFLAKEEPNEIEDGVDQTDARAQYDDEHPNEVGHGFNLSGLALCLTKARRVPVDGGPRRKVAALALRYRW